MRHLFIDHCFISTSYTERLRRLSEKIALRTLDSNYRGAGAQELSIRADIQIGSMKWSEVERMAMTVGMWGSTIESREGVGVGRGRMWGSTIKSREGSREGVGVGRGRTGRSAQESRVLHEPHDVRVVHAVAQRPLREPVPLGARLAVH